MRRGADVVLKQRVAIAVIVALAIDSNMLMARPRTALPVPASASGTLMIESDPAGAAIYVDGRLTGRTPFKVTTLATGEHRVRLVKEGYLENARLVSVTAGPKTVRVKLTPQVASRSEATQIDSVGDGGARSKLPWILALAGGGGAAAFFLLKRDGSSSSSSSSSSTGSNSAPTVTGFSVSPTTGVVATATTFSVSGASDRDGDALTFEWTFGDGGTGSGSSVTHTYTAAGTYTVGVTVSDGKGGSAMSTGSVDLKSLTDTWNGSMPEFGSNGATTVVLTQSGTSLSGTYSDTGSNSGSVSGSVNATTRRVTFTVTWSANNTVRWGFSGTPDDAATQLIGVCTNVQNSGCANNTWTMSRP